MKFYAYCLSDELAFESIEGPKGLGDAGVRLLSLGNLSAVVSEFEGERAAVTRENLHAHNRVNAHVLARVTPLPFRFGTLADEARLSAYVVSNEPALAEALARVRGSVEMGVKIRLVEGAPAAPEEASEEAGVKVEEASAVQEACGEGTAFLLAKRREILGEENSRARAERAASSLAVCVEGLARESDVRLNSLGPIVVRASHLVAREDVSEYRARVRDLGASLEGLQLLASGPWPPYSFGLAHT